MNKPEKCRAYGGKMRPGQGSAQEYEVYCILPRGHVGQHTSATMGRIQKWSGNFVKPSPPKASAPRPATCIKCQALIPVDSARCLLCEIREKMQESEREASARRQREDDERRDRKRDAMSKRPAPWWKRLWNWMLGRDVE